MPSQTDTARPDVLERLMAALRALPDDLQAESAAWMDERHADGPDEQMIRRAVEIPRRARDKSDE